MQMLAIRTQKYISAPSPVSKNVPVPLMVSIADTFGLLHIYASFSLFVYEHRVPAQLLVVNEKDKKNCY